MAKKATKKTPDEPTKEMVMLGKKGKGSSRSVKPSKDSLVVNDITKVVDDFMLKHKGFDRNAPTIHPAIYLAALQVMQRTKDDNPAEHELVREKMFQVVTKSCNSFGVNKMGIVGAAAFMVQTERVARINAEIQVKALEETIKKLHVPAKKEGLTKAEVIAKITKQIEANKTQLNKTTDVLYPRTYDTIYGKITGYEMALDIVKKLKN